ncbi:MAG: hypothetical protein JNK46_00100 [Methylobacteriaceae bacterium]|nr:hypothetical protein [Methylobacteriaceae bacterium]
MSGAVAIWHDIASEGLEEFYAWHGEEHVPERVSIPGFRNGRRFIAREADLAFFNLYETDSPEVVRSAAYKARLDNPTPRTLSAVRHFRHVARSLCRVEALHQGSERGIGQGGLVATLRYDVAEAGEAADLARFRSAILPDLAASRGLAAIRLLVADRAASGYVNAEQRARGAANAVPPVVLVIEGWAEECAFMAFLKARLSAGALAKHGLTGPSSLGFYLHQLTVLAPSD